MTIEEAKAELEKFVNLKTTMRPTFVDVLLKAEPVVRCEDCKRFERNGKTRFGNCSQHLTLAYLSDYCSWGERKDDESV